MSPRIRVPISDGADDGDDDEADGIDGDGDHEPDHLERGERVERSDDADMFDPWLDDELDVDLDDELSAGSGADGYVAEGGEHGRGVSEGEHEGQHRGGGRGLFDSLDGDPRVSAGIDHFQRAAKEMIAASRALLDVAEELVESPDGVSKVIEALGELGGLARRVGGAPSPSGPDHGPDDDPPVQRIPVS